MAANDPQSRWPSDVLNVPNLLTAARLVLALVLFVFLGLGHVGIGLALFVLAASTDWIDGYWARRYGQVTVLGRILDPFADKMVVCGTFVFLAAVPDSRVPAWVAVVILGRELLVTALRGLVEERGVDFSARLAGKWKMVLQCVAAGLCMLRLTYSNLPGLAAAGGTGPPEWLTWLVVGSVWAAVVLTIYSGIGYVITAVRLMRA